MEKLDFNKVIEMYMETSDKLELVVLKDGKKFSEYTDGKLFIHLPQATEATESDVYGNDCKDDSCS